MCHDLQIVVKDSLDKHFVDESDILYQLKKEGINPLKKPLDEVNTDLMEKVLLKMNETPSDDTQRQQAIEEAQK